ncbi:MAG TPA: hypothetical protein VGY97_00525 [Solirubrobacteraceae bacterium]|nr:hypothetical protein [Solirubrobacteraceae bacterium]
MTRIPGPTGGPRGTAGPGRTAPRPLNRPRPARVRSHRSGAPQRVDGRVIEIVRESWLVEDRWWTDRPVRRRYWETVSAKGANVVVFRDLQTGRWFTQR